MKTPEQIAKDIIGDTLKDDGKVVRVNPSIVFRWIERAVYYERREQESYELADHVEAIKKYLKENELPDMTKVAFAADIRDILESLGNGEYDYGDYAEKDSGAAVGVQWKGTDVCFDFYCECGGASHFDGYGAYAVQCGYCGKKFDMPYTLHLKPFTGVFEPVEALTEDV